MLAPFEESSMLKDLSDMPLQHRPLESLMIEKFIETATKATAAVEGLGNTELKKTAEKAYGAWLGFYKAHLRRFGWNARELVEVGVFFLASDFLPDALSVPFTPPTNLYANQ